MPEDQGNLRELEALKTDLLANKISFIEQASKYAVTSLTAKDALEAVVDIVLKIFEADAGSLLLYNPEINKLEFIVTQGVKGAEVRSYTITPGEGVAGWVVCRLPGESHAINYENEQRVPVPTVWEGYFSPDGKWLFECAWRRLVTHRVNLPPTHSNSSPITTQNQQDQ